MLLSIPDKKALWKEIVNQTADTIESGLFYLLLDRCYLDSLERGKALIVVQTRTLQDMIERQAIKALEKAFQDTVNKPVLVSVVVGHPRVIEKTQIAARPATASAASQMDELLQLHRQYGDIMGIVDNHSLFRKVCQPIPQGGWGIFPELLTNACKEYGVLAILDGLSHVANRPGIENPRAYFFDALGRGEFGYRLAAGAPIFPF